MFTGRRFDSETGLYYYRARYYSPQLRRFIEPDPIGFAGGMNLYAYVGNDPGNATDLYGLFAEWYTGVTGMKAHRLFFEWAEDEYPRNELKFDRALRTFGLGISMNRPDVIDLKLRKIYELKPITHMKSDALTRRDMTQLDRYLSKTMN